MFERIARLTYRRPKLVLAAMAAFVVVSLVLGRGVAERLAPAGFTDPAAEASQASKRAVLVLARIKEYRDRGLPDPEAVALGIERTGRVITAAAALLAVVFLAFATSDVFFMKQVAFGQAVAVIIDASIVRALLVPALMRLLGRWNWWAPAPLRRLLPETAHP